MRSARAWPGGYGGSALIGLGVLMLLFAAMDGLRSRPAYVTSTPVAGASMTAAPPAIRVTLSHALHSASTLSVVYLPLVPGTDDISRDIPVKSRLASDDSARRTLEAVPPRLGQGLYLVRWVALPESGGVPRHGSFAFGVGAPVPPDNNGVTYSLSERGSSDRGRRFTMLSGVILLVLGALTWYRASFVQ